MASKTNVCSSVEVLLRGEKLVVLEGWQAHYSTNERVSLEGWVRMHGTDHLL